MGCVKRKQSVYGFQLNDDAVLDEEVDSVAGIQGYGLVHHRKTKLVLEMQAVDGELIVQAGLIGTLKKASAESRVDL